jgi:hypothetical protein
MWHNGQEEECIEGFCGKARRKEPLRPRRKWDDNIKMDFR